MNSKEKFDYTERVFDSYEKRFAKARLDKPLRDPTNAEHRAQILEEVRYMLCLDRIPMPRIEITAYRNEVRDGVTVRMMQFRSWEHCYGEATLFLPCGETEKRPAVMICPGHSAKGRFGYQRMAFELAAHGMVVLLSDNLGQGSREQFGHWHAVAPLCGGINLQGLIVSEANAWIEWLREQDFVDSTKIGVCGNSGGGTLTLFLGATNPSLAAVASSGYPSEFSYVFQKEKRHCCCNLLKGSSHLAEMWEIYSTLAPKPLLLSSGVCDHFFPFDVVMRTIRKVHLVYGRMGAEDCFESRMTDTKHSWEEEDILLISDFFVRRFEMQGERSAFAESEMAELCQYFDYPADAISTNRLASMLVGWEIPEDLTLEEVFPPTVNGERVDATRLSGSLFPDDPMRILSQMEYSFADT